MAAHPTPTDRKKRPVARFSDRRCRVLAERYPSRELRGGRDGREGSEGGGSEDGGLEERRLSGDVIHFYRHQY
jgi:hypothetical protein